VPILERISRLKYNKDFTVGYSPERINPGDKKHTFTKIKKIVSGSNSAALDLIANVYESVVEAGVHRATSIKVAEAAKVVENIQRDVNIGLMNELSQIFDALDIDTKAVLRAAGTKWNFHHYYPGLVGGHCIGVDPYYMIERAKRFNVKPNILETVRCTNEGMVDFIVKTIIKRLWSKSSSTKFKVLVKGITFKEDVNDIRNSKVMDIIKYLQRSGFELVIEDPHADAQEVKTHYGFDLSTQPLGQEQFDVIIMAVNHREYAALDSMAEHLKPQGFLFDIRGTFKHLVPSHKYQTL
jgi:UDP-N-acetyl-D-galactosamine dehydrogenase